MKFCTDCGTKREEGAKFCVTCGFSFEEQKGECKKEISKTEQKLGTYEFQDYTDGQKLLIYFCGLLGFIGIILSIVLLCSESPYKRKMGANIWKMYLLILGVLFVIGMIVGPT